MRILYLLPGLETGGTERLVLDCATRLDANRAQASVGALTGGSLRPELEARGIRVHILWEGVRKSGRLDRALALRRRIRALALEADVVHTHHLGMLLHAAIASAPRRSWKWVHTEHVRLDIDGLYERWLTFLSRSLMSLPDALTGVSDAVTDSMRRHGLRITARCHTIYNGIDVDRFRPVSDRTRTRQALNIPIDAWVIGTVATLRPQKNHAFLLRAFDRLLRELSDARLVLVGGGDLRPHLEQLATELGISHRVHFLGSRLDVPEILATLDAYCLPSHYEGMPLSLFEAMAAGLPIIATDVVGIREVVDHGNTGFLVSPDDVPALASALLRFATEREFSARLGSSARRFVEQHARVEAMLERYLRLYECLADGRRFTAACSPSEVRS